MAKILLIDDDLDHRVPLQGLLEMEGYEVLAASDGEEGFRMARSELPELVLLDIRMPSALRLHLDMSRG
jgi:DNA-binding response OmpR family regulator